MSIFDDLAAEQERLEDILAGLDEAQWTSASAAAGWTVADTVLHLAQTEEMVQTSVSGRELGPGFGAGTGNTGTGNTGTGNTGTGNTVDEIADQAVRMERAGPSEVFERWQRARQAALAALRAADPGRPVPWVAGTMKPATLATTRLAEHWAHGLDITGPLGIDFPDTGRLRHVAWLAHRTLPYALMRAGQQPVEVRCELTWPDGPWEFGKPDAESAITGPGGDFCRVAAQRLDPDKSALKATGPHGATALRLLRSYA
jgi:uncharacterized protein (TIGR03084 family)